MIDSTVRKRRLYDAAPSIPHPDDHARIVAIATGRAIRCLRARLQISQETLGYRAGMHRNFIGHVERGEGNPTTRVLVAIVRGLDLPLAEVGAEFQRCLTEVYEESLHHHAKAAA